MQLTKTATFQKVQQPPGRVPCLFTNRAIVSLTVKFALMALVHCSLLVSLGLSNNFGMQATLLFEMFWGEHKLTSFKKPELFFRSKDRIQGDKVALVCIT